MKIYLSADIEGITHWDETDLNNAACQGALQAGAKEILGKPLPRHRARAHRRQHRQPPRGEDRGSRPAR